MLWFECLCRVCSLNSKCHWRNWGQLCRWYRINLPLTAATTVCMYYQHWKEVAVALMPSSGVASTRWNVLWAMVDDQLPYLVVSPKWTLVSQIRSSHAFSYLEKNKEQSDPVLSLRRKLRKTLFAPNAMVEWAAAWEGFVSKGTGL